MTKKIAEEEEKDEIQSGDAFKTYKVDTNSIYDARLSDEIVDSSNLYFELLHFFDNEVKEGDIVNLKLANLGGSMHVGIQIAHAIKNSDATVVTHVISPCSSMASIIALTGNDLIIYPGNHLMFHNYSGGEVGKGGEIESAHKATKKSIKDYYDYFCSPFLTKEEISSIMVDKDLYVHHNSPGLKKRMRDHFYSKKGKSWAIMIDPV